METIRGKGLIAISTVLVAIVWFDISLKELSFYGIKFESIQEWKFILPLFLTYILFFARYLQGYSEMKDKVHESFVKYLSNRKGLKSIYKRMPVRNSKPIDNIMHEDERISFDSVDEVENWRIHYFRFVLKRRDFLNYFLPIPFVFMGFIAVIIFILK